METDAYRMTVKYEQKRSYFPHCHFFLFVSPGSDVSKSCSNQASGLVGPQFP